jgi:hypothetical protein
MAGAEQPAGAEASQWADDRPTGTVRTAVVVVHGMGEQRPMDTLDGFVKTALHPLSAFYDTERTWDYYYSRPAEITDSYEARRYIARPLTDKSSPEPKQGQAEIYEYHWSYLMTGNRFADLGPTTLRLFLRRPGNVPGPLLGIWRVVWIALLAIPVALGVLLVGGHLLNKDVPWWILGTVSSAIVLLFWLGILRILIRAVIKSITSSFVDVARYLDTAPHSYAARRAIRGGLVDLLHALHDEGRYSRIVIVAHSLGAYIAYDALISFWAEVHQQHAQRPDDETPLPIPLASLRDLERAADKVIANEGDAAALDAFQNLQFTLWQDLRKQGNPWRITDFISVGTPMALADILVTRPKLFSGLTKADKAHRRALLDGLVRRGALVRCPPRTETLPVEGDKQPKANYGFKGDGIRQVLGSQSPFAVTRWTNLWFPVDPGKLKGDWFGGPLRPLFGPGIRDIDVQGNKPERLKRGMAHTEYFKHPDRDDPGDAAWHIRQTLALQTHAVLEDLLAAPPPAK